MDRTEHLEWCKERAREYLDNGDVQNAITSMLSDMGKHEETVSTGAAMAPLAAFELMNPSVDSARRFIDGFN